MFQPRFADQPPPPAPADTPPAAAAPGRLERFGCWFSDRIADLSAHPYAQIGFLLVCALWFVLALSMDVLTAVLSLLAITLSQMVLNRQAARERDAHRRDLALHAKIDELIIATREARNEIAGIEELEEQEIEALKQGNVAPLPQRRRRAAG
jgi:low affinity Fe/Cu permease